MYFPKCFVCMCIHPNVYVPRGVCICCHCFVCMCVPRAPASCCNACINTLLGLSTLSVNWGGKSWCTAPLPCLCSGKQEYKPRKLHYTHVYIQTGIHPQKYTNWQAQLLCLLSHDSFYVPVLSNNFSSLVVFLHLSLSACLFPKGIFPFLPSYPACASSFTCLFIHLCPWEYLVFFSSSAILIPYKWQSCTSSCILFTLLY